MANWLLLSEIKKIYILLNCTVHLIHQMQVISQFDDISKSTEVRFQHSPILL